MYGRPTPPIMGGGLAVTGFYTGSAIIIGIVLLIIGAVLIRMSYMRQHPADSTI